MTRQKSRGKYSEFTFRHKSDLDNWMEQFSEKDQEAFFDRLGDQTGNDDEQLDDDLMAMRNVEIEEGAREEYDQELRNWNELVFEDEDFEPYPTYSQVSIWRLDKPQEEFFPLLFSESTRVMVLLRLQFYFGYRN